MKTSFWGIFLENLRKLFLPTLITVGFIISVTFSICIFSLDSAGWVCVMLSTVIPYISAPTMVIIVFSHLFRRKASDFYHALPIKRNQLFLAGILAVLCAIIICFILPLSFVAICAPASTYEIFTDNSLLRVYVSAICGSIYTTGITTLSVTLTGMYIPAIINAALLVFVPSITAGVFVDGLYDKLPFLVQNAPGMPDTSYLSAFPVVSDEYSYSLYFTVLGIVYLALGMLFYILRKSETAGHAAPNRFTRYLFQVFLCFSICLFSVSRLISGKDFSATDIAFYGIAAVAVVAFELITSHKLRSLPHALVSILATAVIIVLMFTTLNCSVMVITNSCRTISAAQISIPSSMLADEKGTHRYQSINVLSPEGSYGSIMANKYVITDESVLSVIENAYRLQCDNIGNNPATDNSYTNSSYYVAKLFDEKGNAHYRRILLTNNEAAMIGRSICRDPEFIALYTQLPAPDTIKKVTCAIPDANDYSAFDLYSLYYKEAMSMPDSMRLSYVYNITAEHDYTISVKGNADGVSYDSEFAVSKNAHPRTYAYIRSFVEASRLDGTKKVIDVAGLTSIKSFSLSISRDDGTAVKITPETYHSSAPQEATYRVKYADNKHEETIGFIDIEELSTRLNAFFEQPFKPDTLYGNCVLKIHFIDADNISGLAEDVGDTTHDITVSLKLTDEEFQHLISLLTQSK